VWLYEVNGVSPQVWIPVGLLVTHLVIGWLWRISPYNRTDDPHDRGVSS